MSGADLSRRRPDWARVGRAVFRVRQCYRYDYSAPVTDVRQRLVMVPPECHGDQRLLEHGLTVRGAGQRYDVYWERDAFGNRVCVAYVPRVLSELEFEATFRVERRRTAGGPQAPATGSAAPPISEAVRGAMLEETALTAADDRLREVAAGIAARAGTPLERAEAAAEWAAGAIAYRVGVTGVQTPAALALHMGQGVCQDYAHLLLCVLRRLGVPARYVSGHLLGEGVPHAWVEALVDSAAEDGRGATIVYDPTHRRRAGLEYITVAVGRDFADVTPTSGTYSGPATGRLSAEKHADVLELAGPQGPQGSAAA